MYWLRKLLRIQTPEESLLAQLGMDPDYRRHKVRFDGLVFRRISISEMESKIPFSDPRIDDREIGILVVGADHLTDQHRDLLRLIRDRFPSLFDLAVNAILKRAPPDEQNFRTHASKPTIMMGEDGGAFDGKSWSIVVTWGKQGFGYHAEFAGPAFIEVWGGN